MMKHIIKIVILTKS